MSLTDRAQRLVGDHFKNSDAPKNIAVDATFGNGIDTEFLARLEFKQVIGFDIQERAATITRSRMMRAGLDNVGLILDGHETMALHIDSEIDCVMFNLGYLPTGDKRICTSQVSTLVALSYATKMLAKTGIISLLCYPGTDKGFEETRAVQKWLEVLGPEWKIRAKNSENADETTPILYGLTYKPVPLTQPS